MKKKLCINCKRLTSDNHCGKTDVSLVTGEIDKLNWRSNPAIQREDNFILSILMNTCGKRARWFVKKD